MRKREISDLLSELNVRGVEFLIVGGYAVGAHGFERVTKDLYVWIRPTLANARRVFKALGAFGAPLDDLTIEDLSRRGTLFQIGVPPVRIDIITSIGLIRFENAWPRRMKSKFGSQPVFVLSREHPATPTPRTGERHKIVIGGYTTPAIVETFMAVWGPRNGLVDIYGDPARGFAGGFLGKNQPIRYCSLHAK